MLSLKKLPHLFFPKDKNLKVNYNKKNDLMLVKSLNLVGFLGTFCYNNDYE